jgi:hypothetical protein
MRKNILRKLIQFYELEISKKKNKQKPSSKQERTFDDGFFVDSEENQIKKNKNVINKNKKEKKYNNDLYQKTDDFLI